ncbi:Tyrosine-protein kinase baz1b [Rhizophlyctis rosea]|nr:Tyrosine-protein kinase baz1b [Rhizophlyctis rosea]
MGNAAAPQKRRQTPAEKAEYNRQYHQSSAGKAAVKRYHQKDSYKASRRKYNQTAKGKEANRRNQERKKTLSRDGVQCRHCAEKTLLIKSGAYHFCSKHIVKRYGGRNAPARAIEDLPFQPSIPYPHHLTQNRVLLIDRVQRCLHGPAFANLVDGSRTIVFLDTEFHPVAAGQTMDDAECWQIGWKEWGDEACKQNLLPWVPDGVESAAVAEHFQQHWGDQDVTFVEWSSINVDRKLFTKMFGCALPANWKFFNLFKIANEVWPGRVPHMTAEQAATASAAERATFPTRRMPELAPILFPGKHFDFHQSDEDCRALELVWDLLTEWWCGAVTSEEDEEDILSNPANSPSRMQICLDRLINHRCAPDFLHPVKPEDAPAYYEIIEKPMCILQIRKRCEAGGYACWDEFVSDVRQIFRNCEEYNMDGSDIRNKCQELEGCFEGMLVEFEDMEADDDGEFNDDGRAGGNGGVGEDDDELIWKIDVGRCM